MKKLSCLLVLSAALSSTAWGACKIPDSPRKIPDGSKATLQEMKKVGEIVAAWQQKMDAYRECIKDEHEAQVKKYPKADEDLRKDIDDKWKRKDDAAMDEKTKVIGSLNDQNAAYRAAHPKKQ